MSALISSRRRFPARKPRIDRLFTVDFIELIRLDCLHLSLFCELPSRARAREAAQMSRLDYAQMSARSVYIRRFNDCWVLDRYLFAHSFRCLFWTIRTSCSGKRRQPMSHSNARVRVLFFRIHYRAKCICCLTKQGFFCTCEENLSRRTTFR